MFYFYFRAEGSARKAGATLRQKGYKARVTAPDDQIREWSVVAEGTPNTIDVSSAEDSMGPWAEALGGEYDGNEIPIE